MSWYRMVDVRIHGDEKYLSLTPDEPSGRALFKHLLICPENGPLPGVIRAGAAALAEALEWLPERLRERFGELFREGLAEADWKARLVFLPNGIKYNPPNNANIVAGWSKHWDAVPEGPLKQRIWERFHEYFQEDYARRNREVAAGERDKKQDTSAMLMAFLKAMPRPVLDHNETVPGTVPPTVPGTVDDSSAGARARLPDPEQEQNPDPEQKNNKERGRAAGALPPDPHVGGGRASPGSNGAGRRRPEDPVGDSACEAFGEALLAAWPAGHVNPVRFQRALLDVWRQGLIRADGTEPREPKSRTASQVLADMPLWQAYHDSGARPKHLETYLEQRCFQAPVPAPLKPRGDGVQSATRKRWGSDLAPGTTLADVEAAREFDLKIFGPRETLDG